ncbi:hypothetical protein AWC02_16290 [Mycolicibacter engbaekii]|uniref:Uncharacterized protein n=1 Tax=Mycolicibacter engbaekii TaxID=188915 RepID=A0A1X1TEA0_9MYCO|nr:hypothetical protein [Mycolicibacter engbaekii]ORV42875.1 hypothetical protein AWC02_16290 [Mycolicibacter engbaekii]
MSVLIDVALVGVLAACGWALWARRHTWGSRWDTNPSRVLVLMCCAGLLLSPVGSLRLDPLVHRVFGLFNVAGLLAVLCMFGAVALMFEHLVTRLDDEDHARRLQRRQIMAPLKLGLPLVVIVFCIADRGQPQYLDAFAPRGPWFAVYWALVGVLALPLFGFTGRVLLALRSDPRSKTTVRFYLVWVAFKLAAIVTQLASVLLGSAVTLPTWICAGISSSAFAYAAALSWRSRTDWFKPVTPKTPEVAED